MLKKVFLVKKKKIVGFLFNVIANIEDYLGIYHWAFE